MLLLLTNLAFARGVGAQLEAAPTLVWAGLDYSKVHIYTPETFADPEERVYWDPGGGLGDLVTHFKNPEEAWNRLVEDWNSMAVHDHVEDLEEALQREIVVDLPTPAGPTQKKDDVYFESVYEAKNAPELNQAAVQDLVKKYKLKEKKGVGIVFVMERISQPDKEVCAWPTFFDLDTKAVFSTEQVCKKPGGSGYRNYWFNIVPSTIKDMVKAIKRGDF